MAKDGLDKLSQLIGGGTSVPISGGAAGGAEEADDDSALAEDAEKVLSFAAKLAGENIFDLQALIEFCAEELRVQIREAAEGEE